MSANLDLVRSIYAAWERNDWSSVEWADPEIEYVHADGPDAGNWNGVLGMTNAFRGMLSAWEQWRVTPEEYLELDDERVLVPYHFSARGKTSGLEVGQMRTSGLSLFHVRDGKVTKIVQYMGRDRALADLGLTKEGESA
ncbi:MAG TPA: nuclear transport factor 2 family protein [Solirubrobacteraceae bacterium]|jgi:ketosteroid isomerase-like protein|nr:nuclear transport factor 2 family protein [Solirubrobacteraceae bacterium]